MSGRKLCIVVGGYIVGFPMGGMTWHHLNYLAGLQEMGHEVWFLEDADRWNLPFNPLANVCEADSAYGRRYLEGALATIGMPARYCYYSEAQETHFGLTRGELDALLRRTDLLLCVSGVTPWRSWRPRPRRCVVIDTDPVFTQLRMIHDQKFVEYYRMFDDVATFGALIGAGACPLPTHDLNWIATRQPIALRHWPVTPAHARSFTTLGKWEHASRDVEFAGGRYRSSKAPEWIKMLDLPRRVPWSMELAMQSVPADVRSNFEGHGWRFTNPLTASISPSAYRSFIQASAGEFTVVKEIYSALPSGWFSDRAAAFLASGRPVVTQASGFDRWLPTGQGLFSVDTMDHAVEALATIAADYPSHAQAARRLAEEKFDSTKVLGELLQRVM